MPRLFRFLRGCILRLRMQVKDRSNSSNFLLKRTNRYIASLSRLSKPPAIYALSAVIPIVFLLLGLIRFYPFIDDVTPEKAAGNDWLTYKQQALSIVHDGLAMPIVRGNYVRPAGFLYNYFLAGIYSLIGDNSSYVYVLQATMLGASAVIMYFAFRRYLSPLVGLAYLITLPMLLFVDVFLFYSKRLLSENLLIFLLPLFLLFLMRAFEGNGIISYICSGALLGLAVLTRPNTVLFAPGSVLLLLFFSRPRRIEQLVRPFIFVLVFLAVVSLTAVRNHAVTREFSMASFSDSRDWQNRSIQVDPPLSAAKLMRAATALVIYYGRRGLFCIGFTYLLMQTRHPVLPHWLLMWLGVLVFIVLIVRKRRSLFWEAAIIVFLFLYVGTLIVVAPFTYGVRLIVPIEPILLLLGFRTIDMIRRPPPAAYARPVG